MRIRNAHILPHVHDHNPPIHQHHPAQALATLPKSDLKRPIAKLAAQQDGISRALDLLFTGF